jgi:ribosomal 50S subunit-recycling heat shock protein
MPRFRTGKRRSKRTKSVVPVRLWITGSKDSRHLAHTLDISNDGVKLGGCRGEMKVGDKIEIQYRHKQAQFRVAWITAHKGTSEQQIGAECLEPGKQVWGAPFPQQADGEYEEQE